MYYKYCVWGMHCMVLDGDGDVFWYNSEWQCGNMMLMARMFMLENYRWFEDRE